MKSVFKYFYVIFLISIILYGSTYIGFISLRQLTTLIMFIILLKERVVFEFDNIIKGYIVFLFFVFLSSLFEGMVSIFFKDLIAYHFVALVAYQATIVLITKYDAVKYLINTLICLGFFSSVLTILQYYGYIAITNQILDVLNVPTQVGDFERILDYNENLANYSLSGVFATSVPNGYYLSLSGVLALYPVAKSDNILKKVLLLVVWIFVFLGSFCCQQRLSFLMLLLVSVFIFIKNKSNYGFMIYLILLLGVCWIVGNFDTIELGRYASFEDQGRNRIYDSAKVYLKNNLLYGGIWGFREYAGGSSPHNLLLNSLAYSGVFGSIFMFYIIIVQMRTCLNLKELLSSSALSFILLGYLVITANSLTHNMSIVTGEVIFWIMWGAIFAYTRMECNVEDY